MSFPTSLVTGAVKNVVIQQVEVLPRLWDVVSRLGIEPDLLDGYLTEPELPSVNFPHGTDLAKISLETCRQCETTSKNTPLCPIFTT